MRGAGLALWLALGVGPVWAEDDVADGATPTVTPYRPSVSTPAQLSAPGWLEGEFGLLRDRVDGADRDSLPFTLKLALSPDWGLRIGGEALVRQLDPAHDSNYNVGDAALILKRRFAVGTGGADAIVHNAAFGLEAGVVAPSGRYGVGATAYSINTIFSSDLGGWHSDSNLFGTRLTSVDIGHGRWQWGWASALAHGVGAHWSVTGEFSGAGQSGVPSTTQLLLAGSYALTAGPVIDFGAAHTLRAGSHELQWFAGVTLMLTRLLR